MNREQVEERLKYLYSESAHSHYHDGWVIQGMKKEVKILEEKLNKA